MREHQPRQSSSVAGIKEDGLRVEYSILHQGQSCSQSERSGTFPAVFFAATSLLLSCDMRLRVIRKPFTIEWGPLKIPVWLNEGGLFPSNAEITWTGPDDVEYALRHTKLMPFAKYQWRLTADDQVVCTGQLTHPNWSEFWRFVSPYIKWDVPDEHWFITPSCYEDLGTRKRVRDSSGCCVAYWRNTSTPHEYWKAELVVRNSLDSQSIAVLIGMIIADCELAHEFEEQTSRGN